MAHEIVEHVNTIFQCFDIYSKKDNNTLWNTKDSLVDVLEDFFEQCEIETLNPLCQHNLVESKGHFGSDTLCTYSDLLIAIRYNCPDKHVKKSKNKLKLVFTWPTNSTSSQSLLTLENTKAIWIDLPQDNLWHRVNVPVPLCFRIFGKMNVYKLTTTQELQQLSKDEFDNIQVTGLLLSSDEKLALYNYVY